MSSPTTFALSLLSAVATDADSPHFFDFLGSTDQT